MGRNAPGYSTTKVRSECGERGSSRPTNDRRFSGSNAAGWVGVVWCGAMWWCALPHIVVGVVVGGLGPGFALPCCPDLRNGGVEMGGV